MKSNTNDVSKNLMTRSYFDGNIAIIPTSPFPKNETFSISFTSPFGLMIGVNNELAASQSRITEPVSTATGVPTENETMGDFIKLYKFRISSEGLSDKTVKKRNAMIASVLKTWPKVPEFKGTSKVNLRNLLPHEISYDDLLAWRKYYMLQRGPDYTNKTVSMLREVFAIAVEEGRIFKNPAGKMKWIRVIQKKLVMPAQEQFERFLYFLNHLHPCQAKRQARELLDFVLGVVYTGLRKEEAELLSVPHVDLQNWCLRLPEEIVKNRTRARVIPLIPEARPLFERLVKEADPVTRKIFKAGSRPYRAMAKASKLAGLPIKMTPHKLRHFFATVAMESLGNPQIVALLLGHGDGGKLAMAVYSHVRQNKVLADAEKIAFSLKNNPEKP